MRWKADGINLDSKGELVRIGRLLDCRGQAKFDRGRKAIFVLRRDFWILLPLPFYYRRESPLERLTEMALVRSLNELILYDLLLCSLSQTAMTTLSRAKPAPWSSTHPSGRLPSHSLASIRIQDPSTFSPLVYPFRQHSSYSYSLRSGLSDDYFTGSIASQSTVYHLVPSAYDHSTSLASSFVEPTRTSIRITSSIV